MMVSGIVKNSLQTAREARFTAPLHFVLYLIKKLSSYIKGFFHERINFTKLRKINNEI